MALKLDENGTITMYQGDTGYIYANGIDAEKQYRMYFGIHNSKRQPIGKEIMVEALNVDNVEFKIDIELSNLLTVPLNKEYETYYYGIKQNEIGTADADTMFIADGGYGDLYEIIVYPRKVVGYLGG
jgi:aspartate oxidase